MAIVVVEGFDAYNGVSGSSSITAGWYNVPGSAYISMQTGRFGGQAVRITPTASSSANIRRTLSSGLTQGCIGLAVRPISFNGSSSFVHVSMWDSSNSGLSLRLNSDGSISVGTNTSGLNYQLAVVFSTTAAGLLTLNNWSYIELEFTVSNTTGSFNLYVNGSLAASGTNLDTLITSSTYTIAALGTAFGATTGSFDFDDLYVTDTPSRLGEQRIETLYPSADTAQTQWLPGESFNLGANTTTSTTAFATKGDIFTCAANVTLNSVTSYFGAVAQSVKLGVARLTSANPGTVAEVLYESSVLNLSSTAGNYTFTVPSIAFTSGNVYGIYFTRTDGDGTAALTIAAPSIVPPTTTDSAGTLTWNGVARIADNNIGVGDSLFFANTSYVQMTLVLSGLSVSEYAMIDETLMSSSDYVYSNTVGNYDLYDFTNLSSTPTSISAVTVSSLAQKDNVATRAVATTVKSGGSTTDGSNVYLNGGFNLSTRLLETDPNTSSAWTASAVNALQAGVKVTI